MALRSKSILATSVGLKFLVALTGLFLISFLIVHMAGNLLLFSNDGGESFNAYAHFMGTNPIIRILEVVLMLGFVAHIALALYVSRKNQSARPVAYKVNNNKQVVTAGSRFMILSGLIVLFFLILHLMDFWVVERFGAETTAAEAFTASGEHSLYHSVKLALAEPWRAGIYVVGVALLFVHLFHGFQSAFQTLGLRFNNKVGKSIANVGYAFAAVVIAAFMAMPLYFVMIGN